jgi:hypothetical protein
MFSLATSLSSAVDLIEGRIDAAITNGVHCGARFALTAALSHFAKLEPEVELLGSGYIADLMHGQMDAFCARTHRASETLSLRVPLLVTRSSLDGTGKNGCNILAVIVSLSFSYGLRNSN